MLEEARSGSGNGTVIGDGNRGRKQASGANRQQGFMSIPRGGGGDGGSGGSGGGGCGGGRASGGGSIDAPRVPTTEITRLLLAGDLDEYRQASPALSAACVYQEFARGLEDVAKGLCGGSASSAECRDGDYGEADKARGDGAESGADAGEPGWVSKEEFCVYFEAVTDLVDLNGLSLTQPARRQSSAAAFKA